MKIFPETESWPCFGTFIHKLVAIGYTLWTVAFLVIVANPNEKERRTFYRNERRPLETESDQVEADALDRQLEVGPTTNIFKRIDGRATRARKPWPAFIARWFWRVTVGACLVLFTKLPSPTVSRFGFASRKNRWMVNYVQCLELSLHTTRLIVILKIYTIWKLTFKFLLLK